MPASIVVHSILNVLSAAANPRDFFLKLYTQLAEIYECLIGIDS